MFGSGDESVANSGRENPEIGPSNASSLNLILLK